MHSLTAIMKYITSALDVTISPTPVTSFRSESISVASQQSLQQKEPIRALTVARIVVHNAIVGRQMVIGHR